MAPQTPTGTTTIDLPSFGNIKGLSYDTGVRQFCGIPYADLAKRWSRSTLKSSLPGGFHDGTKHGPISPQPPGYLGVEDPMVPVPPFPHFDAPREDEFNCLNLNVVAPADGQGGPYPVMFWIHGGAFSFGSATHPTYDMVNLVSYSIKRGTPTVIVSVNYRVGLLGFLASKAIKEDLAHDGFQGAGNFGLTDQQTALHWVQKHIRPFGGDPNDVTIFGESAGGMSVAHQIWAKEPATFHRGISMSGSLNSIPVWPLEKHEKRWVALLKHFDLDAEEPDALEKLRKIPTETMIAASFVPEGGNSDPMPNPCDDGWFHGISPSSTSLGPAPKWLQAYMVGDTKDEGMIFRIMLQEETYASLRKRLVDFLGDEADIVLAKYDIHPDTPQEKVRLQFEEMIGDGGLKMPNRTQAQVSDMQRIFGYHIDQVSTLDNPLKSSAYHAIDLLYVFLT